MVGLYSRYGTRNKVKHNPLRSKVSILPKARKNYQAKRTRPYGYLFTDSKKSTTVDNLFVHFNLYMDLGKDKCFR